MRWRLAIGLFTILAFGCRPVSELPNTPSSLPGTPGHSTPIPFPLVEPSATRAGEPAPIDPTLERSAPSAAVNSPDRPGLIFHGWVRSADGSGLAGAKIYRGFASYPGVEITVTDAQGSYQGEFQFIPGDEMVRVWAELPGYTFEIEQSVPGLEPGVYAWRHYHGFEQRELNFTAVPGLQ